MYWYAGQALPTPNFRSHSPRIPRPVYEEFPGARRPTQTVLLLL